MTSPAFTVTVDPVLAHDRLLVDVIAQDSAVDEYALVPPGDTLTVNVQLELPVGAVA